MHNLPDQAGLPSHRVTRSWTNGWCKMSGQTLIFVDCEGVDPKNQKMREFGAVAYPSRLTFHGEDDSRWTFRDFRDWLRRFPGRPVFVSDNPAYDWQMINCLFLKYFGENPFGWSARRIGDYYAGLVGDWTRSSGWKHLRVTRHDHNPVNDAMGNLEAWARMQRGER